MTIEMKNYNNFILENLDNYELFYHQTDKERKFNKDDILIIVKIKKPPNKVVVFFYLHNQSLAYEADHANGLPQTSNP